MVGILPEDSQQNRLTVRIGFVAFHTNPESGCDAVAIPVGVIDVEVLAFSKGRRKGQAQQATLVAAPRLDRNNPVADVQKRVGEYHAILDHANDAGLLGDKQPAAAVAGVHDAGGFLETAGDGASGDFDGAQRRCRQSKHGCRKWSEPLAHTPLPS